MSIELTDTGLVVSTEAELRTQLANGLIAKFGPNLKVTGPGPMSRIIDVVTELRAADHQQWQAAYLSFDIDAARGVTLDQRLGLTGTYRDGATHSVVEGILTFASAGTMQNGDRIRNEDNDTQWELIDGPHTSSGSWPEEIAAQFQAVDEGPILADAGTTWSLITLVTGLDTFTNPVDDANPGQLQESDAAAKVRRLRELHAQGQGPLAAIQGRVQRVDGVVFARVWHNTSLVTDADGIPGKAFNVVVETDPATPDSALEQAIWDAIWSAMGAGGQAYGTDHVGTTVDSESTEQPVAFDLVSQQDIVLDITLTTSTSEDPVTPNIAAVVKAKILEVAQAKHELVGRDVRAMDYVGIVYEMLAADVISGVDAVTVEMAIDPASPSAVAKLAIGIRERPDFDSGNVTVGTD